MIDSQIFSGYHEALVPYSEWLFCPAFMSGAFISFAKKNLNLLLIVIIGVFAIPVANQVNVIRKFNIFIFLKKIC